MLESLLEQDKVIAEINQLNAQAYELRDNNQSQSFALAERAYNLANESNYELGIAHAMTVKAFFYFRGQDYANTLRLGLKAELILEKHPCSIWLAYTLRVLSICYGEMGDTDKVFEYLRRQLEVGRELNSDLILGGANYTLAVFLDSVNSDQKSLKYLKKAHELFFKVQDTVGLSHSAFLLFTHALNDDDYPLANQYLTQLKELTNQLDSPSPYFTVTILQGEAMIAHRQGYLQSALNKFRHMLTVARENNDAARIQNALRKIGLVQVEMGEVEAGIVSLEEALQFVVKVGAKFYQSEICRSLYETYREQGGFEQALIYHEKAAALEQSLNNERSLQLRENYQALHESEMERARAEMLAHRNEELELEVQRRTTDLRQSLQREQALAENLEASLQKEAALSQFRGEIIKTISHEFRTPLTVVNSSAELLRQFFDKIDVVKRDEQLNRIVHSVHQLNGLLSNVLKLEAFELTSPPINQNEITLNQFCAEVSARATVHDANNLIEVKPEQADTTLLIDNQLLLNVIDELLENAIHYNHAKLPIIVRIWHEQAELRIAVQDQGIGIDCNDLEKIFSMFVRLGARPNERRLGTGLYFAKRLVERMGGQISAESLGKNQGSTFTISLPQPH